MRNILRIVVPYGGVLPATLTLAVFLVVPLVIVLVYSFLTPGDYGGVKPIPSVEAYVKLLFQRDLFDNLSFNPAYLQIALRSVWVSAATVVGCLMMAFPVAYHIALQSKRRRNLYLLLITIPFWTNLLIRTYCWITILRDSGLLNSALMSLGVISEPIPLLYTEWAVALGLVYTYVPFMIMPIYASLERLDPALVAAARDLYCGRWGALWHVVLPHAMPGIVAGTILVFIPALGSVVAPDLLGGGKTLMLGTLVQMQFASARDWPFGAALAMAIMAVVLVCLTFFALSQKSSSTRSK